MSMPPTRSRSTKPATPPQLVAAAGTHPETPDGSVPPVLTEDELRQYLWLVGRARAANATFEDRRRQAVDAEAELRNASAAVAAFGMWVAEMRNLDPYKIMIDEDGKILPTMQVG
jgi:hypothetical protein